MKRFVALLLLSALVAAVQVNRYTVGTTHVVFEDDVTYRMSLDNGATWLEPKTVKPTVKLAFRNFDPLTERVPKAPLAIDFSRVKALESTISTHLIQFETISLPAYKRELAQRFGVSFHFVMPEQGYIISVPTGTDLNAIMELPYVRWIGDYLPHYKLQPEIIAEANSTLKNRFNVMTIETEAQEDVAKAVNFLGGNVFFTNEIGYRMEVGLDWNQLLTVASLPQVLYIDQWSEPESDMDIAREISGADYLQNVNTPPVEGYTGKGVRAEVCDSGLRTTHVDFRYLQANGNLIVRANGGSTSHGTSVNGIVFGDGTGQAKGTGVLKDAGACIFQAYGSLGNRLAHTQALVDPSQNFRAVFQTNSWGSAQTQSYTSVSAEMDLIIYETDLLILQSQSNTGNRNSRPQAWAKNIVSVGGVRHYDTLIRSDDRWNGGASIGPAADDRIKPDLWHFYDNIYTTSSSSDTAYTSSFGGTSGATPITAGHSGLVFEMWSDGVFDGSGPGQRRDVFDSRPKSSTAKALMINTAFQYDFSGTSADWGRYKQGWGMVNVGRLYDLAESNGWGLPVLCDECNPVAQSATHDYTVNVPTGNSLVFQATLVYRDPQGSPSASKQLINNINLRVTDPSGTTYWGNNGLREAPYSTSGGSADDLNNVENVIVNNAASGTWRVEVIGTEINEGNTAPYSLVVTHGGPKTY